MLENNYLPRFKDNSTTKKHFWEFTDDELNALQVTEFSVLTDDIWIRKRTTPGQTERVSKFNWSIELIDNSLLTDPKNAASLNWAKKLMAIIYLAPSSGYVISTGTDATYRSCLQILISWMISNNYQSPHELTPEVIENYIEDLPSLLIEITDSEEISQNRIHTSLRMLGYLWSERKILELWGVPTLSSNPFAYTTISALAKRLATIAKGWIQPLPDEVSIPLFNKAAWFLGAPSEDVIKLLDYARDPIRQSEYIVSEGVINGKHFIRKRKPGQSKAARRVRGVKFLNDFNFATVEGESSPWHLPFKEYSKLENSFTAKVRVRQLFDAVRSACAIIIQGTTGMRISELMAIKAGWNGDINLPTCVRIEDSKTGLYKVFILQTSLTKTEKGLPRTVDWILGMTPHISKNVPLAVRALEVLNKITEPWRKSAATDQLFIMDTGGETFKLTDNAHKPMHSSVMTDAMKRFIERNLDLSNLPDQSKHRIKDNDLKEWRESKGRIFSSHMLRKSWAQFVFAVNPSLMPAIQLQFHHLSIAMTDTGYIGSNPLLMQSMHQVSNQQRNLLIFETVIGRNALAGKMGDQLEDFAKKIAGDIANLNTSDAWKRTVEICDELDLKIFFSPYATCLPVKTSAMRCHNEVNTPSIMRYEPNLKIREPSLCAGCDNFVLDYRHIPFWEERYLQNWVSYKQAVKMGLSDSGQFKVILKRAQQAEKLLKKIGVSLKELNSRVDASLKALA